MGWVILIAVIVGFILLSRAAGRVQQAEQVSQEQEKEEEARLPSDLSQATTLQAKDPPPDFSLLLKPAEKIYELFPNASLRDYRRERVNYGGRSYGFSMPTPFKGVRFHPRWYSGSASYSQEVLKDTDQGDLILTTQRLIFKGTKKNIPIELQKTEPGENLRFKFCFLDLKQRDFQLSFSERAG